MLKKIKERSFYFTVLVFMSGIFLGINFSFLQASTDSAYRYLDQFHQVYQLIESKFVENSKSEKLFVGAIKGMIKSLDDPFTRYLDKQSQEELKEMTSGKFYGVGIEITIRNGELVVISPIDNSPAMKSGIMAGDVITYVNGRAIRGEKMMETIKKIKGLPGSTVKLTIRRDGFDENLNFTVKRAPIKLKSVESAIIENIGYVKIKNFGSNTSEDVKKRLLNFNKKKIDKVIFDLRYNPGGLLTSAISISDLILKKGLRIVSTKERDGKNEVIYYSKNDSIYKDKLIVLVNKGSASASEILSGAIRDNKRGKLIGEKTFGKGSVQQTYSLDNETSVAITIAKYYTPSGEMIHKKGINPDFVVAQEKMSKRDMKNLKIVRKTKLLENFVKKGMKYSEKSKKEFEELLKSKKIILSLKTKNFILKNQILKYIKKPLFDIEFDKQLVIALKRIKEKKYE